MVQLLKIKEHIYRFIGKYEIYAMAVFRFLVAFLAFSLINHQIGLYGHFKRVSDCTASVHYCVHFCLPA